MPKILCTLENAALEISGIKFIRNPDGDGLISENEVDEPHLSIFTEIPGYALAEESPAPVAETKKETAAERKARLKAEADAAAAAIPAPVADEPAPVAEAPVVADPVAEQPAAPADGKSESEYF